MTVHDAYAKYLLDRVAQIFVNAARLSYEKSNSSNRPYLDIERFLQYLSLLLDTKNYNKLMSETERKVVEALLQFFEGQVNLVPSNQPNYPKLEALILLPSKNEVFELVLSNNSSNEEQYKHLGLWIERLSYLRGKLDADKNPYEFENGAIAELASQLAKIPQPQDLLDDAKRLNESLFRYWSCSHVAPREASLFLADFDQPKITNKTAKFVILLSSAEGFTTWKWADATVETKKARSAVLPKGSYAAMSCNQSGQSLEQRSCICSLFERAGRLSLSLERVDEDLRMLINRPKREVFKISSPNSVGFDDLPSILKSDAGQSVRASLNQLAITLAYTFLHLYDDNDSIGSWICTDWVKYYEDSDSSTQRWIGPDWLGRVRFLYHSEVGSGNDDQRPNLLRPYLCSRTGFEEAPTFDEEARAELQHGYPSLLALGIGLLKIQQMRAGEKMLFARDAQPNINSDLDSAMDILDRMKADSKSRLGVVDTYFLEAINACLDPDDLEIYEVTRSTVRKYVREKVITCLELNLFITRPTPKQMEHLTQGVPLLDIVDEKVVNLVSTSVERPPVVEYRLQDVEVEKRADRECLQADEWCKRFEAEVMNEAHSRKEAKNVQSFGNVKVAILDTGLEVSRSMKAKWLADDRVLYKSWVNQVNDSDWEDKVGHGTHSAGLLIKFAPDAKIHVARVFEGQAPKEHELLYIAEAINHAVSEWKVDIITMSFGLEATKITEGSRQMIKKALQFAHFNDVTMFAAASNEGRNRPGDGIAWPASALEVISVHSGVGKPPRSTRSPCTDFHGLALWTLGESVQSDWPPALSNVRELNRKRKSGTSTATPIAAAIAAVLVDYIQSMGCLEEPHNKNLRSPDGIFAVLKEIMDPEGWLQPWKLFLERDDDYIAKRIRDKLCGN